MDRNKHTGLWLEEVAVALAFAAREVPACAEDPDRWRWVSVAMAKALQAALVAALSGYDTAAPDAVRSPSAAEQAMIAPIALLLRRARSADYLDKPERLDFPGAVFANVDILLAYRNNALHGTRNTAPALNTDHLIAATKLITHLTCQHPAFPRALHALVLTRISDHARALLRVCDPTH